MRPLTSALTRALALALLLLAPAIASAQSSGFAPAARVNDRVVTFWELDQRSRFLTVLGAPPEVVAETLDRLIEERLQEEAAASVGATVSAGDLQSGLTEFAARGNLTPDEFVTLIARAGIDAQTYRDFVEASLLWREAVRARFAGRVDISDRDLAFAVADGETGDGRSVLLSEIVLPAPNPAGAEAARREAAAISEGVTEASFAAAARERSVAPSAAEGGALGWIPLASLPPAVAAIVADLRPGQVTPPVPVANGIALFQLRGVSDAGGPSDAVHYAEFLIPGTGEAARAQAARIRAGADTCDDLFGAARGLPEARLVRESRAPGQLPGDVAGELSRLDTNEISTSLVRGGALVVLMRCEGAPGGEVPAILREGARQRLTNERLQGLAQKWLAELRADATIEILR